MSFFILAAFIILTKQNLCACSGLWNVRAPQNTSFLFCADDGTKIAPDFTAKNFSENQLEPSPEEIERYYRHKKCKNLDRARELGTILGEEILSFGKDCPVKELTPRLKFHAMMLYLFVCEHCLLYKISDPILSKLILAQINDTISQTLPDFYTNVCQYRSYTQYKLCLDEEARSKEQQIRRIGKCWAHITGDENDPELCTLGEQLYQEMSRHCEETLNKVSFCAV